MGKYEEPHFQVVVKEGSFEVRKYEAFVTATTKDNTLRGSGFNKLFSFISGENETKEKLAMTIPVINDAKDQTMEFVLPLRYTSLEKAPIPSNPNVALKEYKPALVGAYTFSGRSTSEKLTEKIEALKSWLISKNYKIISEFRLARYNAPLTPGFLRRNEILFNIEEKS